LEKGIPVIPGTSTPTDIERALEFGLDIVKFFPAEAFGGIKTLKAISAPYGMMRFVPTGGIGPHNILDYLENPKVPACGGSWMVKSDLIAGKNFAEIVRLTREAVELVAKAGEMPSV
jgi:2-dehydro-3-deoxyphosphogluconate aldolase/(4S)-4-hydroxy-2-oxoglutarate aldolase